MYEAEMSTVCQQCGTREDDWFDSWLNEQGEQKWAPRRDRPFEPYAHVCEGCRIVHAEEKRVLPDNAFELGQSIRMRPRKPDGVLVAP